MLTNNLGLPILESNDSASAAAIADLAQKADDIFALQESSIDYLERPEAMIVKLSGNQAIPSGGVSTITFDTIVYSSRSGCDAFFGLLLTGGWRPGIYQAGVYCQYLLTGGTVNSVYIDLVLQDLRGSQSQNQYSETERAADGGVPARGAGDLGIERIFELRSTFVTSVSVNIAAIGGGTISVTTPSRLWIRRVRGL